MNRAFLLLLCFALVLAASAQEATPEATPEVTALPGATSTCPELVQTAIALTEANCTGTGLNEACYGYILIESQPRPGLGEDFLFENPGDIVSVVNIQSLQLSALDVQQAQWGVILLDVEANVEGEVTTEDVQILLFGDTRLEDAASFVQVTANADVNIRRRPTTESETISGLRAGEGLLATARLDDGSWLRVRSPDIAGGLGWVAAQFLDAASDVSVLPSLTAEEASTEPAPDDLGARYGPMQAFFFESGMMDAPCPEAPNSGMLIQTPEGVASVTLWLDEVVIQLDGTAFVGAEAGGTMQVDVLEGSAQVEANGETSTAVEGQSVSVEMDENLSPVGAPSEPTAIDPENVQALPVGVLDDPVATVQPLAQPEGVPIAGQYEYRFGVTALTCPDGSEVSFQSAGIPAAVQVREGALLIGGLSYTQDTPGIYRATYQDNVGLHQDTLTVLASDRISGEKTLDLLDRACTLTVPFSLQLIRPDE